MVKGLTIDVTTDTNNLSARLRVIAKHATALLMSWKSLTSAKSWMFQIIILHEKTDNNY